MVNKKKKNAYASGVMTKEDYPAWTFFSNHAHVLIVLTSSPGLTLKEVALQVGITERAVQNIIVELENEGYIEIVKSGRRNDYKLKLNKPLRHPIERHRTVEDVISLIIN